MSYQIQIDGPARQQIAALPQEAVELLPEIWAMLEITPWAADPMRRDNPTGALRTIAFGEFGLITYLILDHQRIIDVLSVIWI